MNLPDDYGMFWRTCPKHRKKFHASDGGCDYCIHEAEQKFAKEWEARVKAALASATEHAQKYGLSAEVEEAFNKHINNGYDPESAAGMALYDWDI